MKTSSRRCSRRALGLLTPFLLLQVFFTAPLFAAEQPGGYLHIWGNDYFDMLVRNPGPPPAEMGPIVSFAASSTSRSALRPDGSVIVWDGAGTRTIEKEDGQPQIISLHEAERVTFALRADGQLIDWPQKIFSDLSVPADITGIEKIAGGSFQTLALDQEGAILSWGYDANPPFRLPRDLADVQQIAAEGTRYIALKKDGTVIPFLHDGVRTSPAPEPLESIVAVAAGSQHYVALLEDGSLRAWNNSGWLPDIPTSPMDIIQIAAAGSHTVALTRLGEVFVWGTPPQLTPTIPEGVTVSAIFTNQSYVAVLADKAFPILNEPLANISVQPGQSATFLSESADTSQVSFQWYKDGTPVPEATGSDLRISNVQSQDSGTYTVTLTHPNGTASSSTATLTVSPQSLQTTRGPIQSWGYRPPRWEEGPNDFVGVAAGFDHALFLRPDGTVVAAGRNHNGQADLPPNLPKVKQVAAGSLHSMVITEGGEIVAWGDNRSGQIDVPEGLTPVRQIAAGSRHSVALKNDGTVVAWGDNRSGQTDVPPGLTAARAIACGDHHTLVLSDDGTVSAWGRNRTHQTDVPADLSQVIAIAAGGNQSVALRSDGTIVAWGGISLFHQQELERVSGVTAIAASSDRVGYILADGSVQITPQIQSTPLAPNSKPLLIHAGSNHFYVIEAQVPVSEERFQLEIDRSSASVDGLLRFLIHDEKGRTIPLHTAQQLVIESRDALSPNSPWKVVQPDFDLSHPSSGTFFIPPTSSQSFYRARPEFRHPSDQL